MQRTSAWPLALTYLGLIVYASLYPFSDWRDQGISPLAFLWAAPSRYWTAFDVGSNLVGYFPLGFLLTLSALRARRGGHAVALATLAGTSLSLVMETLQSYLPMRVPSNTDWMLNTAGAWLGALAAHRLEVLGAISRWSRMRARWFVEEASGGLFLLALWPVGLLFPVAVPFGLGQVIERVEGALADWLEDSPFLSWLPVREVTTDPLPPLSEVACVAMGLLIPCIVACCVVRTPARRLAATLAVIVAGMAVTALSAALTYSPRHAWGWLETPSVVGVGLATVGALLLPWFSARTCAALGLLGMGIFLGIVNQQPADPYFAQTLQTWEQGRFIRFNGLAQWVGWSWPYLAIVFLVLQIRGGQGKTRI